MSEEKRLELVKEVFKLLRPQYEAAKHFYFTGKFPEMEKHND